MRYNVAMAEEAANSAFKQCAHMFSLWWMSDADLDTYRCLLHRVVHRRFRVWQVVQVSATGFRQAFASDIKLSISSLIHSIFSTRALPWYTERAPKFKGVVGLE